MAKTTICLALLLVLPACGSHNARSPEQVARSWSAALDHNDNEAAGRFFARGAEIVQNTEIVLTSDADAVRWNAALPCGGEIVSVTRESTTDVLVVFKLQRRPHHACDTPGQQAAAIFRVRAGKIVLWHQTSTAPAPVGPACT